jgi:16S rRNA (cytidine1402-2'-O)-methyltransferase
VTAGRQAAAGAGTLYVVATPIGNLGDLSPRAGDVLRSVDAVAAEDTRRTLKLFAHLGAAPPPLLSLPAFDERGRLEPIVARLRDGQAVALCTDAGTPGVSDPGAALVSAAWAAGARVVPVPGPSAALAALAASGLPADRFLFTGFLPRKGAGRAEALAWLARVPATLVLYEAGNRTGATLEDLGRALGPREAAVARELTKLHEEIVEGPLSELASALAAREFLGEITLVLAPWQPPVQEATDDDVDRSIDAALAAGLRPRDVAARVSLETGRSKRDVYQRVVDRRSGDHTLERRGSRK